MTLPARITCTRGEVIANDARSTVIGLLHPLNGKRVQLSVKPGLTVAEALTAALAAGQSKIAIHDLIVHLGEHPIDRQNWSRIRVKPGAVLTFRPTLKGGALKTALSVAIGVAALVVAGPLATALLPGAVTFGTALISTGIAPRGTIARSALWD